MTDTTPIPDHGVLSSLADRGFVVVGAGQGMGRQTAHALAQAGASGVVCVDIDADRAHAVAEEITVGTPWVGDVRTRDEVQRLTRDVTTLLDRVDGLVDIVGLSHWNPILEIDDATWDATFDVSLRHAYLLSQELGRLLVESGRGGSMVFISSVSGLTGAPNHAAYGAAKAALNAWVRSLAVELGPAGVRANAVAPGSILTPRLETLLTPEQVAGAGRNAPLGRMGTTADIAAVVRFLCSDASAFITGQTLVVDGGVSAKFPYGTL